MSKQAKVPASPVFAKIVAPGSPDRAFGVFTQSVTEWWPMTTHSVFGPGSAMCAIEPQVGGRFYERAKDGRETVWGNVTAWNEPHEFTVTWHPNREPESAQQLTVKFSEMMFGTTIEIEHVGWEALGDAAKDIRQSYEKDWPMLLQLFLKRLNNPPKTPPATSE